MKKILAFAPLCWALAAQAHVTLDNQAAPAGAAHQHRH